MREGPIQTEQDAVEFMKRVKFALRYNSTPSLPLASMYAAARDTRRAIELTNALLARKEVIETNVIAGRLVLVYRDIVPALYALRIRLRPAERSGDAARALDLIGQEGVASVGEVRRFLEVQETKRPDRADAAVSELQRDIIIDRGPSAVPKNGIPYLSKEGFPYRLFETAHPDLVKAAKKLVPSDALAILRSAAAPVPSKKFISLFKLCLTAEDLASME